MYNILNEIIDYSLTDDRSIENYRQNEVLIIEKTPLNIIIAISDRLEQNISEDLKKKFSVPIKQKLYTSMEIKQTYQDFIQKKQIYILVKRLMSSSDFAQNEMDQFFHLLIKLAITKNSSDIHIETVQNGLIIRLRIDGKLLQTMKFGFGFYPVISAVIKVISGLDISRKRLPQNGRFSKKIDTKSYDFRVSIMPINDGESIVIRILQPSKSSNKIEELGISKRSLDILNSTLNQNQGLILVTGPTGSGKTTTLYSLLNQLNLQEKKIITLEDPVEYKIDYLMQIAIDETISFGYAKALKDVLRQDPDVIMIGEIRDAPTLQIVLQAALTGHLVLATLHTNDALSTIDRLLDLEALPYLISATLKTVLAQRLVRSICKHCNNKGGCIQCNFTGYSGRMVISELLQIDENITEFIKKDFNKQEIKEYLKTIHFQSLYQDGLGKVADGLTTIEEIQSVCKQEL